MTKAMAGGGKPKGYVRCSGTNRQGDQQQSVHGGCPWRGERMRVSGGHVAAAHAINSRAMPAARRYTANAVKRWVSM